MTTVETGARLHFGFQNLSLAHDRLYGGVGVGLASPTVVVEATPAPTVRCDDPAVEPYARQAVEAVGVPGATVCVHKRFDRHVGLGSGTQLALACLVAVARTHGRAVDPRVVAPAVGRGGRSGVGVATFETGGFIIDAGHPTERFTTAPPETGEWRVPAPIVCRSLPPSWRFVLVVPEAPPGLSGQGESESMHAAVEGAAPEIADEIGVVITRQLLPAIAEADLAAFGDAVARLGRLNGAWYANEQGGVYRPPAGEIITTLADSPVIAGAGQSSWGPTVYGATRAATGEEALTAAHAALDTAETDGRVRLVAPADQGASVVGCR
jgi:beta-ribofuranosylaminobenzene 5'-phosphate synthase